MELNHIAFVSENPFKFNSLWVFPSEIAGLKRTKSKAGWKKTDSEERDNVCLGAKKIRVWFKA